jgi:dTDP-4-dehydrorhamnose 3,5-epimerase
MAGCTRQISKGAGGKIMGQIKVEKTPIDGVIVIEPAVHGDSRGYFMETYNRNDLEEIGFHEEFVQDNQSRSTKGVMRGLHYQIEHPQGKLVRVIRGSVFDVAVDLRRNSETYGKWFGIELTEENKKQLFIPKGFAHGFLVLSDIAEFCYKVTDFYHPGDEGGIMWNDADIGIKWPMEGITNVLLSDKDKVNISFREYTEKK